MTTATLSVGDTVKGLLGVRKQTVDVNGSSVSYLERGRGEPILFLHGFAGNKSQWRTLMGSYDADRYQAIAVDVPGFCFNRPELGKQCGVAELSCWVGDLLRALDLQSCHIVAHSGAAFVAVDLAVSKPDVVISLTLANTPQVILPESASQGGLIEQFLDSLQFRSPEDFRELFATMFYSPPAVPNIMLDYNYKRVLKAKSHIDGVVDEFLQFRPRILTKLNRVEVPCLAVGADHDIYGGGGETLETLRTHIKGANTAMIEKCGHMSFIERPRAFIDLHQRFLGEYIEFGSRSDGLNSSQYDR